MRTGTGVFRAPAQATGAKDLPQSQAGNARPLPGAGWRPSLLGKGSAVAPKPKRELLCYYSFVCYLIWTLGM
jgi:ribosomal protein L4